MFLPQIKLQSQKEQLKSITRLPTLVKRDHPLSLGIANYKQVHGAAAKETDAWRDQVQCKTRGSKFLLSKQKPLGM